MNSSIQFTKILSNHSESKIQFRIFSTKFGLSGFSAVGAKRVFLQLNCCKNQYHQSRRENMKITNNSQHQSNKVTQWKTITTYSPHLASNNYVAVKSFHMLNTKNK